MMTMNVHTDLSSNIYIAMLRVLKPLNYGIWKIKFSPLVSEALCQSTSCASTTVGN